MTYPKSIATQEVTKLALIYKGSDMLSRTILSSVGDVRPRLDEDVEKTRLSFTRTSASRSRSGQPWLFIPSPPRSPCGHIGKKKKVPCGRPFFLTHFASTESISRPPVVPKNFSWKMVGLRPFFRYLFLCGWLSPCLCRKCLFEQSRHTVVKPLARLSQIKIGHHVLDELLSS